MFEPKGHFEPVMTLRVDRRGKLIKGHLIAAEGSVTEVMIRNLSAHGIGGYVRGRVPREGTQVQIAMDRIGTFTGTVRWCRGHAFGVECDTAIDVDAVSALLRVLHQPSVPNNWQMADYYKIPAPKPQGILRRL